MVPNRNINRNATWRETAVLLDKALSTKSAWSEITNRGLNPPSPLLRHTHALVCACMAVCVRACTRACVRACLCACVPSVHAYRQCAQVCPYVCVHACCTGQHAHTLPQGAHGLLVKE